MLQYERSMLALYMVFVFRKIMLEIENNPSISKERGIVTKGKMGFSERKHTFKYVLKLSDEGMARETKLLRKNYVLNGIMRTNVSPKKFKHDVRINVANILLTDNT